jgi:hypothetical protein
MFLINFLIIHLIQIVYTLEDLKCLVKQGCGLCPTTDFTQQKNIQSLPVAERVNYDFVKTTTLTDLLALTFF